MDGFIIVVIIAVILFARLGIRLVYRYIKLKQNNDKNNYNAFIESSKYFYKMLIHFHTNHKKQIP